jgi:hypothetical protein
MALSRRQLLGLQLRGASPTTPAASDPDIHLLNRATWGPRPADVAHIKQIGRDAWLEEQLHPQSIDDTDFEHLAAPQLALFNMSRHDLYGLNNYYGRVESTLIELFILRAVHSKRQLLERMVEFWSDHFNIPSGDEPGDLIPYYRDAIRQHALGKFKDMLMAVVKSPAMLIYLDGAYNVAEHPNENYARELLELHTLGVDGGYTEQDIREAARALTGWTTHPRTNNGFYFSPEEHDTRPKTVLGHKMPAGRGIEDGLHLLMIAANHPSTARHLSFKLCRRFVSDNPPDSLVASTARIWQQTQGEIVPVMRHIFSSHEFYAATQQKMRRPLNYFIGALRATGARYLRNWSIEEIFIELGQRPYGWGPPNGYPDTAEAWISTGGLLARWNLATFLTQDVHFRREGSWGWRSQLHQRIPPPGEPGGPTTAGELVDAVASEVFGAPLSGAARNQFVQFVAPTGASTALSARVFTKNMPVLMGLMLASPMYQWY